MWIKTTGGTLVNLALYERIELESNYADPEEDFDGDEADAPQTLIDCFICAYLGGDAVILINKLSKENAEQQLEALTALLEARTMPL